MSLVEVIVPCYNYGHFLRQCVESVLVQEGVDVRVLVIDDASQDHSEAVGRALAAQDPRVEYRRHAVNRGHIATYNEGIDWLSGDYALLLSADDMLTPRALRRATQVLNAHPEAGFAFGRAITTITTSLEGDPRFGPFDSKVISGGEFIRISCELVGNIVPTPTMVVRTDLQKGVGGYREELPHTGDLEMCMRLAANGAVAVIAPPQAYYRVHGENMHKVTFRSQITILDQHWQAFRFLFQEQGNRIPEKERLCRLANRTLALWALNEARKAFDAGDEASCSIIVRHAHTFYPPIRSNWESLRMSVKQAIGFKMWQYVGPFWRAFHKKRVLNPPLPNHGKDGSPTSPFRRCGIFAGM